MDFPKGRRAQSQMPPRFAKWKLDRADWLESPRAQNVRPEKKGAERGQPSATAFLFKPSPPGFGLTEGFPKTGGRKVTWPKSQAKAKAKVAND